MKIRKGFVSNSSTTSFCIIGVTLPIPQLYDEDSEDYDVDYYLELIDEIVSKTKLDVELQMYYNSDQDDGVYFGAPIQSMQDSETLAQFKQRVKEAILTVAPAIKFIPPTDFNVDFIEESWTDG